MWTPRPVAVRDHQGVARPVHSVHQQAQQQSKKGETKAAGAETANVLMEDFTTRLEELAAPGEAGLTDAVLLLLAPPR